MADFKKILDHPEKQRIISKLVSGEKPTDVAQYLRLKYNKDDESHLRLPVALLKEFIDTYGDHHGFLTKIIKDKENGKLDGKIAKSLLENKDWNARLVEFADQTIDVKKRAAQILNLIESRAEQVFDKIQQNPESVKSDYVMIKYFEIIMQMIEKLDKIVNERPDMRIEHTYTVQMVEDYSAIFQEAIRETLQDMSPEHTTKFLDVLQHKLEGMNNPDKVKKGGNGNGGNGGVPTITAHVKEMELLEGKGQELGELLEEEPS
jgi:hypothetical protein